MLLDADLSALEWRVGAELSRDPIMIQEIVDGIDMHTNNAIALFGDAKFRQEAKVVSFRALYGGSAYAFHMDYRMPSLGLRKWEKIMEEFSAKYKGLIKWQNDNYRTVTRTGVLKTFTGREYVFNKFKQHDGGEAYNRSQICNYPVQGTATADVMPLCMLVAHRRLKAKGYFDKGVKFINQVHDSIIMDAPEELCQDVGKIIFDIFADIPTLVKNYWGYDWVVPMAGEVKVGDNWSEMTKLKF